MKYPAGIQEVIEDQSKTIYVMKTGWKIERQNDKPKYSRYRIFDPENVCKMKLSNLAESLKKINQMQKKS